MKELSTEAQHLIGVTRGVDGPNRHRREAVRVGLHAALAAGTTSAAVHAALAQASHAATTMPAAGSAAGAIGAVKSALLGGGMLGGVLTGIGVGTVVVATAHFTTLPSRDTTAVVVSAAGSASSALVGSPCASASSVAIEPESSAASRSQPSFEAVAASVKANTLSTSEAVAGSVEANTLSASEAVAGSVEANTLSASEAVAGSVEANTPDPIEANAGPTTVGASVTANTSATLADETRLLARTQLAIRSSDPGRALALLDEYEQRFSKGSLLEEARAARVLALCKAGHLEQGRAAANDFQQRFPKSPLVPRVRRSCDLMR